MVIQIYLGLKRTGVQSQDISLVPHAELYTDDTLCEIYALGLFLFSVQAGGRWTIKRRSPLAVFLPARALPGTTIFWKLMYSRRGFFNVMHPFLDNSVRRHYCSWVKL
jgi:hypothetical protein